MDFLLIFGRHFLFFEDQFALRRHLFLFQNGRQVFHQENWSEIVTKTFAAQIRIANQKLTHNKKLINFAHQKQEIRKNRAEIWKNAFQNGLHFYKIEDSFIGGRQVFGVKLAAI